MVKLVPAGTGTVLAVSSTVPGSTTSGATVPPPEYFKLFRETQKQCQQSRATYLDEVKREL